LLEQHVEDAGLRMGVKVAGGLVRQEALWSVNESAAQGSALFLPLGKAAGAVAQPLVEARIARQLPGAVADLGGEVQFRVDAVREQDVLQHVQRFEELEVLKDQAELCDTEGAASSVVELSGPRVADGDGPLVRQEDAGD
jgi:hypothetical protein